MEKVKRVKKHRVKNLPLKWSFMLYVSVCAVVAITLLLIVFAIMNELTYDLHSSYSIFIEANEQTPLVGVEPSDANYEITEASDEFMVWYNEYIEKNEFYNYVSGLSIPIICFFCILVTGVLFYNRKLKIPLQLIDSGSAKIADGDLDFQLSYDNRNEMGRLVTSFETMRAALLENYKEMWRKIEQRKCLNAAFAHDLRTPLTVLKGYVEYLQTYVPQGLVSEEKIISTTEIMHTYITRLEGYTASMSMVQKLEEAEIKPEPIELIHLANRLQSAGGMLCGEHSMNFQCNDTGVVIVDSNIVTQVLENLVSNAARYAAKEIHVGVCLLRNNVLQLVVSDDGAGFPDAIMQKGISPYNHLKDENLHSEHYGLGLYICRVLCKCHGGDVAIENHGGAKVTATFACK